MERRRAAGVGCHKSRQPRKSGRAGRICWKRFFSRPCRDLGPTGVGPGVETPGYFHNVPSGRPGPIEEVVAAEVTRRILPANPSRLVRLRRSQRFLNPLRGPPSPRPARTVGARLCPKPQPQRHRRQECVALLQDVLIFGPAATGPSDTAALRRSRRCVANRTRWVVRVSRR